MKKLFMDTNILLDVFLHREQFSAASAAVIGRCETGAAKGIISAISLNNLHFIMSKRVGKDKALEAVRIILNIFTVIPLDDKILRLAADLPHRDFEDAIQLYSAIQGKADLIITRDTGHFPSDSVPILLPDEFLAFKK